MKKSRLLWALILVFACSFATISFADNTPVEADLASDIVITPDYVEIQQYYNYFGINGSGMAMCDSSVTAINSDKIQLSVLLQKYTGGNWVLVKSWNTTSYEGAAIISEDYYLVSGYQYRMKSFVYVYIDNILVDSDNYTSDYLIY